MTACNEAGRFSDIMLPHIDAAYTLARYLARDAGAAEDIVQDSFLRALRGFAGWRGDNPRAWLLAIVRNCFMDSVTGAAQRAIGIDIAEWTDDPPPELVMREDPEAELARKSDAAMLRGAVEALPVPYREVIVLRELDELSYKEIAEITRSPIGTVMSRLSRARQLLAERLLPARDGDRAPALKTGAPRLTGCAGR